MSALPRLTAAAALTLLTACSAPPPAPLRPPAPSPELELRELPSTYVEYRFDLLLDEDESTLSGSGVVRLRNTGREPLRSIPLVLYPNRFRELDPKINDVNFDRFYTFWFDGGGMTLVSAQDAEGAPLKVEVIEHEGLPAGTHLEIELPSPVERGAWGEVHVSFELEIPDRLGPFGQRGERIVLEGGALPYVPARDQQRRRGPLQPPARARYDLSLQVVLDDLQTDVLELDPASEHRVLIGGGPPAEAQGADGRIKLHTTSPLIAAGPDMHELVLVPATADAPQVRVFGEAGDEERAGRLAELAQEAGTYFHRNFLPTGDPGAITFVQAPLRDRFLHATDQAVLYSDRLFRLFFVLRGFHEVEVQRIAILSLVRQAMATATLEGDRDWICEALSWAIVRELVTGAEGVTGQQIRNFLSYFDFPAVDQILRAPKFAGSDVYYGRFHETWLSVPDELSRALSRRQRGRVVIEKLRDRLGHEGLLALVRDTLNRSSGGSIRRLASKATGSDLSSFFELWLGPLPVQNLSLARVEGLGDLPDGGQEVEVTIRRTGDERVGQVGEPVDVVTTGPDGEQVRGTWDGAGDEGKIVLRHDGGWFTTVQLDPDDRVAQGYPGDDVRPRYAKFLLSNFSLDLDLNSSGKSEGNLAFTIHPYHRYDHSILLGIYADEAETGVSVGYGYSFGRVIDERSFSTGVRADVTYQKLRTRGFIGDSQILESEGALVSLGAGVGFDTRLSSVNPSLGLAISAGMEYSDRTFGTDFRFIQSSGQLTLVYSLIRGTTFAAQAVLGQTDGNRIPTQRLFDAGGVGSIRGVEGAKFYDESLVSFRTEIRQMLVEDIDQSLLWSIWLRKIQAVGFVDTGNVGRRIDSIFRHADEWKVGAGAGIRLHLDLFGVSNFTVRFDVAVRLDDNDDDVNGEDNDEPQFYMGVKQTF